MTKHIHALLGIQPTKSPLHRLRHSLLLLICALALILGGNVSSAWAKDTNSVHHKSTYATGVARDAKGRIARSSSAKKEFMKQTGYPNGRPGYVVDHIVPLKRGGADTPANMQWQTIAEGKAKDKIE